MRIVKVINPSNFSFCFGITLNSKGSFQPIESGYLLFLSKLLQSFVFILMVRISGAYLNLAKI